MWSATRATPTWSMTRATPTWSATRATPRLISTSSPASSLPLIPAGAPTPPLQTLTTRTTPPPSTTP
eukprot:7254501-Pyramimonas_sp.AAC.1